MKYLFSSLLLLLFLAGCKEDDRDCAYTQQGDLITLNDGTQARLSVLADERCPCLAQCVWGGYIGMTLTVGNDTILKVSDVFGQAFVSDSIITQDIYYTSRGDQIRLLNVFEPENSCAGSVAGEDLCLELEVE